MDWKDGQLIRNPKKLKLGKILKLSYEPNEQRRQKILKKYGYVLDKELSDAERIVAFNPFKKDLLYVPRGTELKHKGNIYDNRDLQTDIILGAGGLKQTERYEREKDTILKAKKKYNEDKAVFVGHSLSGGLLNSMPEDVITERDTVIGYNAPILKQRKNTTQYRTQGDIFSVFNTNAITLPNQNPISARLGDYLLKAHAVANLDTQNIFV
jgi:hypothetical protein